MLSASPERNTFQRDGFLQRQAEKGLTPENDEDTRAMVEMYESWDRDRSEAEADPEWHVNNMESDLRGTDWIVAKVRASEAYAQNLYAAMCNNDFQRIDVWPVLKNETWGCSWRSAGGIVANMRGEGDYIDWYCSGIRNDLSDEEYQAMTKEQQERWLYFKNNFVGESVVTDPDDSY